MTDETQQQNSLDFDANQTAEDIVSEQNTERTEEVQSAEASDETDFLPDGTVAKKRKGVWDKVLTVSLVVLIVVLITFLMLRWFVVCGVTVSGDSMMPNYTDKSVVWVDKLATPNRGDVVVLYKNYVPNKLLAELYSSGKKDSKYGKLIKRVVALPGDKLWVEEKNGGYILVILTPDGETIYEDGIYTVNGQKAMFADATGNMNNAGTQPYLGKREDLRKLENATKENPFVVKADCFFFLGDNRFNSTDSRTLGALPFNRLYGVVIQK